MRITEMRIGDLAARTGVGVRLLRYYEEQGLLAPRRTAAGQRVYEPGDVETVRRIRRLLEAGLGTRVIRIVLGCVCGGEGDVEPCLDPLLLEELERMDGELARLARHRRAVEGLRPGAPAMTSEGVSAG
ncbi:MULTISPECIES: MerR family transcriptional regulator [unclassified Nocardiopsis]|uniref:MerR family transcriptional regulator n=1 Tax=Nocardiopsis TaxID=2013 RepID=UPI00387B47DC